MSEAIFAGAWGYVIDPVLDDAPPTQAHSTQCYPRLALE